MADNWEIHNFGIEAEPVYCENCGCKINPTKESNRCEDCQSFSGWLEKKGETNEV